MDRVEHGLLSTYVRRGCKCPQCAAASRDYARARTRARAYGQIPPLVDVGTVRAHLTRLAEHGIGQAQVAALSGIGRSTITHILRRRGPRRGVTPRVAAAILAVDPSLDNAAATARLGATWPEVQARTGARRNSIETACARAGRRELAARITSNRRVAA